MFESLKLKTDAFGLDISDRSIKIIKFEKKKGVLSLVSFGETKIEPGVIESGEIKDQKSLSESIRQAVKTLKGEKLRTNYAVVSLPEEKAFLEVIQLPILEEEKIKAAANYEAENHIPLPIEDVYLDSQIVKPVVDHLDHLDVLIVAMPKKTVDPYITSIKNSGLIPKILETESQAISRSLVKNGISPFPLLIINIGLTKTSFIIFSGYSLRFTSSISTSSQNISEIISRGLGIGLEDSQELKATTGLNQNFSKKRTDGSKIVIETKKIIEIINPLVDDLVNQAKSHLSYYQSYASHEHLAQSTRGIQKILLSGDGARFKGLDDLLALKLKIPVETGNPWINILPPFPRETPGLNFDESLAFTTALGLGLRALEGE